jgi:putative FmdB family regulatory protein
MPVYEYRCEACEEQFELMRKFSDPKLDECPRCGKGPVEKLISRSSFALKGSGWYKSDYGSGSCSKSDSKPACAGCPSASSD